MVTEEDTACLSQNSLCYKHMELEEFYNEIGAYIDFNISELPGVCNCAAEHEYSFVIAPNGYLHKCLNEICNPEHAIGSVVGLRNGTFSAARYMGRDPFSEDECTECPYLPVCYGGCVFEYKKHNSHACKAVKFMYIKECIKKIGGE